MNQCAFFGQGVSEEAMIQIRERHRIGCDLMAQVFARPLDQSRAISWDNLGRLKLWTFSPPEGVRCMAEKYFGLINFGLCTGATGPMHLAEYHEINQEKLRYYVDIINHSKSPTCSGRVDADSWSRLCGTAIDVCGFQNNQLLLRFSGVTTASGGLEHRVLDLNTGQVFNQEAVVSYGMNARC